MINCKLDPTPVQEARKAEMENFQTMQAYKKVPVQKCKDVTGQTADKCQVDSHKQSRRSKPLVTQSARRKGVEDVQ